MQVHTSVELFHALLPRLPVKMHQVAQRAASYTTDPGMLEHSPVLLAVGGLGGLGPAVWLHTVSAAGVHAEMVPYPMPQLLQGSHGDSVWFGVGWK